MNAAYLRSALRRGLRLGARHLQRRLAQVQPQLPVPAPASAGALAGRRVVYVATAALSTREYLVAHLRFLSEAGAQVHLAAEVPESLREELAATGAQLHLLALPREIALVRDLAALRHLWRLLRRLRPDLLVTHHPKPGLLGNVAGALAGVPRRSYVLHGLRFETARGFKRALLLTMERLSAACAHEVVCVGVSLRARALSTELAPAQKLRVLKRSSVAGVAPAFFEPVSSAEQAQLRAQLGLPERAWVIGFVGRAVRDKGISELAQAFTALASRYPQLHLLLVGGVEAGDPPPAHTLALLQHSRVHWAGFVHHPAPYYALMHVLALPSYREGLAGVPLEAAAAGVPTVASRTTGLTDTVHDEQTGLLIDVGNVQALEQAVERLLLSEALRARLGSAAQQQAQQDFERVRVLGGWLAHYQCLLAAPAAWPWWQRLAKRGADVALVVLSAPLTLPLALGTAAVVRAKLGSPVAFKQPRLGQGGAPFEVLKFRTMTAQRGPDGQLLPDAERLTPWGQRLRDLSLDELPQLLNVLRGEMSLVGPRPLPAHYYQDLPAWVRQRLAARPGLTGLAQVQGRNHLSWPQKFALDAAYVAQRTWALDSFIVLSTALNLLLGQSVRFPEGQVAWPLPQEFKPPLDGGGSFSCWPPQGERP